MMKHADEYIRLTEFGESPFSYRKMPNKIKADDFAGGTRQKRQYRMNEEGGEKRPSISCRQTALTVIVDPSDSSVYVIGRALQRL